MLYRADLHIHTVLSPCGDLEMSPRNIIHAAMEKNISILGITDHNTTRQAPIIQTYAQQKNIYILLGAEVTTSEEIHCLTFFPTLERLATFQHFLDQHLPYILNDTEKFGYQVAVNPEEEILYEEQRLLLSALDQNTNAIAKIVQELDGIFIPAHIDKPYFSICSQLGFIPTNLPYDALELSPHTTPEKFIRQNTYLTNKSFIRSSDAHYLQDIGKATTSFKLSAPSFSSIRQAIRNQTCP